MRKDDCGLTPPGGTLVDDVVKDTAAMSPASPSSGESRPSAGDTTAAAATQPDGPAATESAPGTPAAAGPAGTGDAPAGRL